MLVEAVGGPPELAEGGGAGVELVDGGPEGAATSPTTAARAGAGFPLSGHPWVRCPACPQ